MMKEAYQKDDSSEKLPFQEWVDDRSSSCVNFKYWKTVFDLECILFMFVLSIRQPNFDLFVKAQQQMCPWLFIMNRTHYERWMPIFLRDLKLLPDRCPDVYNSFCEGMGFTVRKTKRRFLNIAPDQTHEQNNKTVKSDGGAIGILDSPSTLLKWAISAPEIAKFVSYFTNGDEGDAEYEDDKEEDCYADDNKWNHDEDTPAFEKLS